MVQVKGQLEDSQGTVVKLAGCRVEAFFDQRFDLEVSAPIAPAAPAVDEPRDRRPPPVRRPGGRAPAPDAVVVPQRVVADSDANGQFAAQFPDPGQIATENIRFVVSAPTGSTIGESRVPTSALGTPLVLVVAPEPPIASDPAATPPAEPTVLKVRGKVVDLAGLADLRNRTIVVYGAVEEAASPLFAATSDRNGYFVGEYPPLPLSRCYALITGYPAVVDIVVTDRQLPDPLLLVVEFPAVEAAAASPEDCGCKDGSVPRTPSQTDIAASPDSYSTDLGTGRCVQFNVPNRAIEEFDFYTVVRTTEPEIRGTTFGGRPSGPDKIGGLRRYLEVLRRDTGGRRTAPALEARGADTPRSAFVRAVEAAGDDADGLMAVVRRALRDDFGGLTDADTTFLSRWLSLQELDRAASAGDRAPGRAALTAANPIDWDSTPTFYEATTIAHGHILHCKQVWYADGYSLGDLLYSLPLAPGQKKLVSVVDWERRDTSTRSEETVFTESLYASLSRDRDVKEVVSGVLSESMRGGSKASTSGFGGGLGAAASGMVKAVSFGAVAGISGGFGSGDSDAWQRASRDFSGRALQRIRDNTLQSASAVRGLRSTVVHTTAQGESVRASTEAVANHNHCSDQTVRAQSGRRVAGQRRSRSAESAHPIHAAGDAHVHSYRSGRWRLRRHAA